MDDGAGCQSKQVVHGVGVPHHHCPLSVQARTDTRSCQNFLYSDEQGQSFDSFVQGTSAGPRANTLDVFPQYNAELASRDPRDHAGVSSIRSNVQGQSIAYCPLRLNCLPSHRTHLTFTFFLLVACRSKAMTFKPFVYHVQLFSCSALDGCA